MRLSEVYTSTQGEGPRVGRPTTFVRFAGCNLKCPGWACDTQHAIDPKLYRHEWQEVTPQELFDVIEAETAKYGVTNICLTGGEPFLQPANQLQELVARLRNRLFHVEAFTNGTLLWPMPTVKNISFVMDWKLRGSGEVVDETNLMANVVRLGAGDSIKFTVASRNDLVQAYDIYHRVWSHIAEEVEFFVGPVWGKFEPAEVVEWILEHKLPWRLTIQTHKYIWPPDARRT